MLTNFKTIRQSIKRLKELTELSDSGALDKRGKKEATQLRREMDKLERSLGGIKDMEALPDALFVDRRRAREDRHRTRRSKLGIPVVAIVDTNCSPGRHRLRDPRQRRRHARHPALRRRHRRRGARGQGVGAAGRRRARTSSWSSTRQATRAEDRHAAASVRSPRVRRKAPARASPSRRSSSRRRRPGASRRSWSRTTGADDVADAAEAVVPAGVVPDAAAAGRRPRGRAARPP